MKTKIYDLVKGLLESHREYRDSDKKLIWRVWWELGYAGQDMDMSISYNDFMEAPSTETIRRCRQKIQELYPELRGSKKVQEMRAEKAKEKGTFVFREQTRLV